MKSIKEILSSIADILMRMSIINFKAMSVCQRLGFNGFKRWHRHYAKDYYDYLICVDNKAFDYYAVSLDYKKEVIEYDAKSMSSHFQLYKEKAEKNLAELGALNKEFYELTGFYAPEVKCIKEMLLKQIEKCSRMIYRYKSIGSEATGLHDLHTYDDLLHSKMRKKEEQYYERY